jgi:hypothetical protein
MYSGTSAEEESSKTQDTDFYINFRRFVQETRDLENWVSTCEGFFAPWVGPNNNMAEISRSRNPIFSKIVNQGNSRLTIECGDSEEKFFNVRVDDVKKFEQATASSPGATPASLGNRFNIEIGSNGALKLDAAGAGVSGSNTYGVRISINENGELSIFSKGKMTFSHSEKDLDTNSIVMDPKDGIDINAVNGVRINGQEAVLAKFIEWMDQNKAQLCQVTSIGGPAPIHPTAQPGFATGVQKNGLQDGFTSKGTGSNASGKIESSDNFHSV